MNRAPLTLSPAAPAGRAHRLFAALGLRHVCVVDPSDGTVRGLITRRDLMRAEREE